MKRWGWPLAIFALGAGLRLPGLGRDSLWFDEAISYLAATLPISAIFADAIQDPHPPLYYVLLRYWLAWWPTTDAVARLMSAVFGIALIPASYLLALELLQERRLALITTFLLAVSPFHILYSHELRMYTQLMLLTTLLVWVYWRAAQQAGNRRWWLLFVLLGIAALYTHLFAALPLAAIGLFSLRQLKQKIILKRTIASGLIMALAFAPWLVVAAGDSEPALGSWRPLLQAHVFSPIKPLTTPTFLLFGPSNNLIYSGLALFLTLSMMVVLMLELLKARRHGEASGLALPLLIVATTLGVPVAIYLIRPFFLPERTLAAGGPFLILLLAWGTTRRGSPLPYLVGLTAVVMLAGTLLYHAGPPLKPPYRAVTELVDERRQPGDAVLHTSDGSYLPALRYADWPDHALLAGDPDPRKPVSVYQAVGGTVWSWDEVRAENGRLWIIVALEHSYEWQQEQVDYFSVRYALLDYLNVDGIGVYLFDVAIGSESKGVPSGSGTSS